MRARSVVLVAASLLSSCAREEPAALPPPALVVAPTPSAPASAPVHTPASVPAPSPEGTSAPATAPSSAPALLPALKPGEVIARMISAPGPIIACGYIAFIGVYEYEILYAGPGAPTGRVVVDLLCPDFAHGVAFKAGAIHRFTLSPPQRTYAGAVPPKSPRPALPRFAGSTPTPP